MIENISTFSRILTRFKFAEPVPAGIHERGIAAQKRILAGILKEKGSYNLLLRMSLRLFYFARSIGTRITVVQSAAAVSAVSIIAAGAIASGSYVAVKNISPEKQPDAVMRVIDESSSAGSMIKTDGHEKPLAGSGPVDKDEISKKAVSGREPVPSKLQGPGAAIIPAGENITGNVNRVNRQVESGTAVKSYSKVGTGNAADAKIKKETGSSGRINNNSNQNAETVVSYNGSAAADARDKDGTAGGPDDNSDEKDKGPDKNKIIFFAGAGLSVNIPSGDFKRLAAAGPSLDLSFGVKNLFIKNFHPFISSGVYVFSPKGDSGKSSVFIPLFISAAYQYIFMEKYFLSPEISLGGSLYRIDTTEMNEDGLSLAAGAGLMAGYLFSGSVNFNFGIRYYNFILKSDNLNCVSIRAGAEKSF